MTRHILFLIGTLALILAAQGATAQAPPPDGGWLDVPGPVRVIDGDTVEVFVAGRRVGVGLIGFRAPQGNTACGRKATALLAEITASGLTLEEDPDITFDSRKRRMYRGYTSARPSTKARESIAFLLVFAGLARADGRGFERDVLAATEEDARLAGRGCVWSR